MLIYFNFYFNFYLISLEYREALIGSRRSAGNQLEKYGETLRVIPDDISAIRAKVGGLRIYPIKALSGLRATSLEVGTEGLETIDGFKDRMAMLVQRKPGDCLEGKYDFVRLSQRTAPQLCLIKTTGQTEFGAMDYEMPDHETFRLYAEDLGRKSGETVVTKMFDDGELVGGVL